MLQCNYILRFSKSFYDRPSSVVAKHSYVYWNLRRENLKLRPLSSLHSSATCVVCSRQKREKTRGRVNGWERDEMDKIPTIVEFSCLGDWIRFYHSRFCNNWIYPKTSCCFLLCCNILQNSEWHTLESWSLVPPFLNFHPNNPLVD